MKVETDLKAGAFLQDATDTVSKAAGEVAGFFNKAGQQAKSVTDTVVTKSTNVWNALVS